MSAVQHLDVEDFDVTQLNHPCSHGMYSDMGLNWRVVGVYLANVVNAIDDPFVRVIGLDAYRTLDQAILGWVNATLEHRNFSEERNRPAVWAYHVEYVAPATGHVICYTFA